MPPTRQPPRRGLRAALAATLGSRVARSVALWVLASIVAVELVILVPSMLNRRAELVAALDARNRYAASTVFRLAEPDAAAAAIARLPDVLAVRVRGHGDDVTAADGAGPARIPDTRGRGPVLDGDRVITTWSFDRDGQAYAVTAVLDGAGIHTSVWLFGLRILGLVLLIAGFVTVSTLAVVGHRVLRPLGRITSTIQSVRRTGQRDYIDPDQPGEFGELVAEYNATISEQRAAEERGELMHHQAMHDPLTGLPNRSLFADRLDQALTRSRRYGERAAVLLLDVDRFKLFNDTYGHVAGDALLGAVGERLADALRTSDTVARIGGDEFAFIQPRAGTDTECLRLAERVRAAMAMPFEVDHRSVALDASVGVTVLPDDGNDRDTLLVNADLAMYKAKHEGGGRVRRFESSMRTHVVRQVELEDALQQALDTAQFELHYQPIVDLREGTVSAFEALLRWQHPDWGTVPPGHFLPLVEQTAMIGPLGDWVLQRAVRDFDTLRAVAPGCERVTVNVSAEQLELADADVLLARAVGESGVTAAVVTLEITETAVLRSSHATIAGLERAAGMGALIAIDDFGTGYSSLAQVQDLPGHVLKIDRRFVAGLSGSERAQDLFHSIVAMGHSLRMKVVAEGIETPEQLAAVRACGCDAAQGFLFARPQALAALRPESEWMPTQLERPVASAPGVGL